MSNNTQILRLRLLEKIRAAYPTAPAGRDVELAAEIEATGAYACPNDRLVPIGDRAALAKAERITPSVHRVITAEHVAASSSASSVEAAPYDRARARLQSLGIDIDRALAGGAEDGRQFYGLDLSNMPKGAA